MDRGGGGDDVHPCLRAGHSERPRARDPDGETRGSSRSKGRSWSHEKHSPEQVGLIRVLREHGSRGTRSAFTWKRVLGQQEFCFHASRLDRSGPRASTSAVATASDRRAALPATSVLRVVAGRVLVDEIAGQRHFCPLMVPHPQSPSTCDARAVREAAQHPGPQSVNRKFLPDSGVVPALCGRSRAVTEIWYPATNRTERDRARRIYFVRRSGQPPNHVAHQRKPS